MNYEGKKGLANAFTTLMDCLDPTYERVKMMNSKGFIPRYHIRDDGEFPRVVDLIEEYPNEKLILIYSCGYVYVGRSNGEKLFMSMHSMSNNKIEVETNLYHLIKRREEKYNETI